MCIHSEPRFDFLKEMVADVADLQGDFDDVGAAGGSQPAEATSSTSAPPAAATKRSVSMPSGSGGAGKSKRYDLLGDLTNMFNCTYA